MGNKFVNPVRSLLILNSSVNPFSSMATAHLSSAHFLPLPPLASWARPPPSLIWVTVKATSLVSPLSLSLVYLEFIPHTATSIIFKMYKSDHAVPLLKHSVLSCGFKTGSQFLTLDHKALHHLTPTYLSRLTLDCPTSGIFSAHLASRLFPTSGPLHMFSLSRISSSRPMHGCLLSVLPQLGCHYPRESSLIMLPEVDIPLWVFLISSFNYFAF